MDVILLWWVSFTSFWRTRLIKWVCGVWEILQKWEKLSYSCLDPSNHSSMHISTDTKYINPWLKIVGWFLFLIHEENFNMKVLVLDAHFCSWRFFSSATRPSARIVEISPWKKEPHITPPNELQLKSRANLFVNLHFFLGCVNLSNKYKSIWHRSCRPKNLIFYYFAESALAHSTLSWT